MVTSDILNGPDNALLILRRDDLIEFAKTYADQIQSKRPVKTPQPDSRQTNSEQPISQPEATRFLGKSRQTLIKWRKQGIIKGHTLGGRVYYLRSELLLALTKQKGEDPSIEG